MLGLLWMAWRTLEIPNTQSATGILYVAVIGVFIGELTGLLLSAESALSPIIEHASSWSSRCEFHKSDHRVAQLERRSSLAS